MPDIFKVKTNEYLSKCDSKDVISFDSKKWVNISKLKEIVDQAFENYTIHPINDHKQKYYDLINSNLWFREGEKCEVLKAGSPGWQKGKIKIRINVTLAFIPDELEEINSPLDDIRQEFKQNN